MATIGVFSLCGNTYHGSIHTLSISASVKIVPSGLEGEKSPQHLVMVCDTQVGAGWSRTSRDSASQYVSIKLDDPCFPEPIFANLVPRGDEHHLIWSREDLNHATKS